MRILLLLPIILYLGLVIFNRDLLLNLESLNIYGITNLELPVIFYSVVFFVIYSIFLILVFDSIIAFKSHKIRKSEKEIFTLKSKLYDEREDELVVFMEEQKRRLDDFLKNQEEKSKTFEENNKKSIEVIISENKSTLEKQKEETNKILSKLNLLDEGVLDKIKKTFKSK